MKIYSKNLISSIQNVINSAKFKMKTFHEYDFCEILESTGIRIRFYINEKLNKRECMLIIHNTDITSKYISDWRTSAPGKFCMKDYKKDTRDFIGNTLYHEITFVLNGEQVKVLIRLLNEITDTTLSDSEKNELIKQYGDITIDNKYFSIIKIIKDNQRNSWASPDIYRSLDTFIDMDLSEGESYIDSNNDADIENIEDDSMSSDPLF